jgi:flavin reductase (DIM6/NTAB) family NADH-FMN oxidoreductase RutF
LSERSTSIKTSIGAKNVLYPLPTTLVGANVRGSPNYIAIAHIGVMAMDHISVSMNKRHYTNAGIAENQTFSVNIPSVDMAQITDYMGLVSGQDVDKASLVTTFYGELETAPMIAECPLNIECRLVRTVDFAHHDVFIGQVVATYCQPEYLTDGAVDLARVQPLLFCMTDRSYWQLGSRVGRAWEIGTTYRIERDAH